MARSRSLRVVPRGPAPVDKAIQIVRGRRVVLGPDLARIYGVDTRALTQAVKRNADRFPEDFVFRLTRHEAMRSSCAFLRLREWSANQAELSARVTELEHRVGGHDDEVEAIIDALRVWRLRRRRQRSAAALRR